RDALTLAGLPAQVDLPSAQLGAEVDETAIRILHLDAEFRDLAQQRVDLACDRITGLAPVREHPPLQIFEQRSDFREDGLRLGTRELRHMLSPEYRATEAGSVPPADRPKGAMVATYVLLTKVSASGVKTIQ